MVERGAFTRIRRVVLIAVLGVVVLLASAGVAFGLPPFTTGTKSSPPATVSQAQLVRITTGCGASYDRLVFRFGFGKPGYRVRYVARVFKDPSGKPLPLPGSARLSITFQNARAHTAGGAAIAIPPVITPGCSNLLKVKQAGDFEGVVSYGAGLAHRAGFRVFRLTGPTRVVIDVAH